VDDEPIRQRLKRFSPDRLADELVDLGRGDPAVRDRLDLLAVEHDALALGDALKRRIAALGRAQNFISYGRSFSFARELQYVVTTIRERALPCQPALAFELADAFLKTDARVFERADDSSGSIGDVYRDACRLWLEAASRCRDGRNWVGLLHDTVGKDDYGVRGDLLPNAAILLSEEEIRRLVARYLGDAGPARPDDDELDWTSLSAASSVCQLAIALRDPRLYEEARSARRGGLNDLQRIDVAQRYLEFGDPETALAKLSEMAEPKRLECLDLFAECFGRLGRRDEQVAILERLFQQTLSKKDYERLMELRPEDQRQSTAQWARETALGHSDACMAATFLFQAGWPDDAERLVLGRAGELAGTPYPSLLDLAALAEAGGRSTVEIVCYRHLIRDVLDDARSRAYGHAVRYLGRLEELDRMIRECGSLGDHAGFVAELRKRHGRKSGFWGRVEGKQRSR